MKKRMFIGLIFLALLLLAALGTALVGRRTSRTFRLGDPIEVRVAEIRRHEGKVELEPGR